MNAADFSQGQASTFDNALMEPPNSPPVPGRAATPRWPRSTTSPGPASPRPRPRALAGNTRATYASQWNGFVTWCEERGVEPLAAEPAQVAAFLAERAETRKLATVQTSAAAILAAALGLEGVSSHSGRRGLASELVRRGASTAAVQLAGCWRSAAMVARYASAVAVEDGAVAKFFGGGGG